MKKVHCDFFHWLLYFYRPCSADDSFEFIDFPVGPNKAKETTPLEPHTCSSVSEKLSEGRNEDSTQKQETKDSDSLKLSKIDKTSSQCRDVPNTEDCVIMETGATSCSACSCNQSNQWKNWSFYKTLVMNVFHIHKPCNKENYY